MTAKEALAQLKALGDDKLRAQMIKRGGAGESVRGQAGRHPGAGEEERDELKCSATGIRLARQ